MRSARAATVALCAVTVARAAAAQGVSGTVSDSATRLYVPGAVVAILDSAGRTVARTITNARGEYRLPASMLTRRVRVVRMGFRPRSILVAFTAPGTAVVDVSMVSIPTMLEQVRVVAGASCPRRPDRQAALALLEQARAGLLNSVVAREAHAARMTILPFERTMMDVTDRIEHQRVRVKSSDRATTSFSAVRGAREFVQEGFIRDSGDTFIYYGPDADVLLDEGFASGYCFHLRAPDRDRANQVGLAFAPSRRHARRVDIDGTLWIDTAARKLRDLEYRYLGLPAATAPVKPGGRASFWELPNGIVFIDKWSFRLPVAHYDTRGARNDDRVTRLWYSARETGGEVASSSWPDGESYQGPLGILNARAVNEEGRPVTGIVVRLDSTNYVASPDSLGFFEITNLLPGPYTAVVVHPEVAHLGILLPTSLKFVAVRDSIVQESMWVPNPREYVRTPCPVVSTDYLDDPLLLLRVQTPDKKPVAGAHWQLRKPTEVPGHWVTESRTTDADGRARHCMQVHLGDELEIHVWRENEEPKRIIHNVATRRGLSSRVVTITLPLPPTH